MRTDLVQTINLAVNEMSAYGLTGRKPYSGFDYRLEELSNTLSSTIEKKKKELEQLEILERNFSVCKRLYNRERAKRQKNVVDNSNKDQHNTPTAAVEAGATKDETSK